MDDLISRQAVLGLIAGWTYDLCDKEDEWRAEEEIKNLPSAERKKGKWIPHEDEDGEHYGDKCSECGEWYVMPYGKTNYCPNCGAEMRGDKDE